MTKHAATARRRATAPQDFRGYESFHGTVADYILQAKPALPTYILDPEMLASDARRFVDAFKGKAVYAVKCNPDEAVVKTLYKNGVKSFDVASMAEIALCHKVAPKAKMYFMHPVKSPESIHAAYFEYGVRAFVLDSKDELYKIIRETKLANDLELYVRLRLPKNASAAIDFSSKFGALPEEAAELLSAARSVSTRLGLCLHVGTQTTDPSVYGSAIGRAADVIERAGVKVDVLDIGGGFPVEYEGEVIPPLDNYMAVIEEAVAMQGLSDMELIAEPGRVLVARSTKLIVRVEARKGDLLFLNDGTYGGLFDAGAQVGTRYPVQHHAAYEGEEGALAPFRFAGPTCDSLDMMDGPFYLPDTIKAGDWIEIGQHGAYSRAMRTDFNGYGNSSRVVLLPR